MIISLLLSNFAMIVSNAVIEDYTVELAFNNIFVFDKWANNSLSTTIVNGGAPVSDKLDNGALRLTDEQAQSIMKLKSGCGNAIEFQGLLDSDKEKYLKIFKNTGMSIRQASRLTGVSVALVRKYYNT